MAFKLLLIVLLVLVSLSQTPGYSLLTRDAVSKQDDKSYVMATSDHGSSMIVDEDLVKARSLHEALLADSKVVVSKKGSKSSSSRSSKSKKVGSFGASALVGIIIAAIVVTIVIICLILKFYGKYKGNKAQRIIEQEEINGSSETQTPKTENHV